MEKSLAVKISAILFAEDPIGINLGQNTDEYDGEAERIGEILNVAKSVEELQKNIYEIFVIMFDKDIAGVPSRYEMIAKAVWKLR